VIKTLCTKTTVTLNRKTRDQLARLGKKDDSFDAIIQNLIVRSGSKQDE